MILPQDMTGFMEDLACLIEDNVFELEMNEEEGICLIPYMMNDALECYYSLSGCSMQGTFDLDFSIAADGWPVPAEEIAASPDLQTRLEYLDDDGHGRHGLIIHQGSQNVSTLWFTQVTKELHCYRYHEIGHFWKKGCEQWRRLCYILGTTYDKYLFLGEELSSFVLNEEEIRLLPVMEFAPFKHFSPVDAPIMERYEDTERGCIFFEERAKKLGLTEFSGLCRKYREALYGSSLLFSLPAGIGQALRKQKAQALAVEIIAAMQDIKGAPLFQSLVEDANHASGLWPKREFSQEQTAHMNKLRIEADRYAKELGFEGEYPRYLKNCRSAAGQLAETEPGIAVAEQLTGTEPDTAVTGQLAGTGPGMAVTGQSAGTTPDTAASGQLAGARPGIAASGQLAGTTPDKAIAEELLAVEEHPFTKMDPDFTFKIRFMHSVFPCKSSRVGCSGPKNGLTGGTPSGKEGLSGAENLSCKADCCFDRVGCRMNLGFFNGPGLKGEIIDFS